MRQENCSGQQEEHGATNESERWETGLTTFGSTRPWTRASGTVPSARRGCWFG